MILDSRSVEALDQLVHVNIDSHWGLKALSARMEDAECRSRLREIAWKRRQVADLLLRHMNSRASDLPSWRGKGSAQDGTLERAVHPWSDHVRTLLEASTSDLISEAERGEDVVEKCYERVFTNLDDGVMRDVLGALYREVRRDHNRLRALSERATQTR
jgi:uncharacterized protein (TIGR02284 family)